MPSVPASQLDAVDPLARFRARFVAADDPSVVAYLDGNSLGRPLAVTGERLAGFVAGEWGRRLIRGWDEAWLAEPVTVGDRLAEVTLGAAGPRLKPNEQKGRDDDRESADSIHQARLLLVPPDRNLQRSH